MCIVGPVVPMLSYGYDLPDQLGGITMELSLDDNDPSDQPPPTPPKLARHQGTLVDRSSSHGPPPLPSLFRSSSAPKSVVRRRPMPNRQFLASAMGDVDGLVSWLNSGGDPNMRDSEGWVPLLYASMNGRTECVRLLLGHGARHDICSSSGQTPLHGSAANRHYSVVRSLVEAGACVNAQNEYGNTPLHSAAATGSIDVLSYLLSQSADPDVVNTLGMTADCVSGAGPEAFGLVQHARRKKKERIAQRLALVGLHKLSSTGRGVSKCPIYAACASTTRSAEGAGVRVRAGRERSNVSVAEESEDDVERRRKTPVPQQSLETSVAVVTALPEEVLRRLVAFCGL